MWFNSKGHPRTFRVLYVNPEGREYWLTLSTIAGADGLADPPFLIYERADGIFEAGDRFYTSLDEFATMNCCLRGELVSVDPGN